jgi:hypothetical protein
MFNKKPAHDIIYEITNRDVGTATRKCTHLTFNAATLLPWESYKLSCTYALVDEATWTKVFLAIEDAGLGRDFDYSLKSVTQELK